jgi:hypothetical protein
MRKSILIAATLTAGAGATAVGAATLPNPYYGSDTLATVTTTAITNAGITQASDYIPGGSGAAQSAMANKTSNAAATQQTGPMSKMFTGILGTSKGVCTSFGGSAGSAVTGANGVVIGMDAIDIYSSIATGGTPGCNGGVDPLPSNDGGVTAYPTASVSGFGATYTGLAGVFGAQYTNDAGATTSPAANVGQNWKWALALLYGGLDYSQPLGTVPDCNSAARRNLVANWGNLFQATQTSGNSCTSANVYDGVCSDTTHNGALWHAFRRDDGAGTSDIFSNILGLQLLWGPPSESGSNGFGAGPYCNALNVDVNTANNGNPGCAFNSDDIFIGPGGVADPNSQCTFTSSVNYAAGAFGSGSPAVGPGTAETCGANGSGNHRMPPPGVWGTNPVPGTSNASNFDVLPTFEQDNDPIRRPCIGKTVGNVFVEAEEVCNLDGKLGLVVAVPGSDFIANSTEAALFGNPSGLQQYPTQACSAFVTAPPPSVFNCAAFSTAAHNGECPNGDTVFGGSCIVPATGTTTASTSQCLSGPNLVTQFHVRNIGSPDGRAYNLHMFNGTISSAASTGYITFEPQNGTSSPPKLNFVGGMGRVHSVATIWNSSASSTLSDPPNTGCQMAATSDQIGCLTQADPCSIGFDGDGAKTWAERLPSVVCQTIQNQFNSFQDTDPLPPACNGAAAGLLSDSARIDTIYPTPTTVTALGSTGTAQGVEYQFARKLYFNSLIGFANLTAGASGQSDNGSGGELTLAEYESSEANMVTVLTPIGYFPLGLSSYSSTFQAPFCEDFNEAQLCGAATNRNACPDNAAIAVPGAGLASIPSTGSICGNSTQDPYEECDDGATLNGTPGDKCNNICHCATGYSYEPSGSGYACQATSL